MVVATPDGWDQSARRPRHIGSLVGRRPCLIFTSELAHIITARSTFCSAKFSTGHVDFKPLLTLEKVDQTVKSRCCRLTSPSGLPPRAHPGRTEGGMPLALIKSHNRHATAEKTVAWLRSTIGGEANTRRRRLFGARYLTVYPLHSEGEREKFTQPSRATGPDGHVVEVAGFKWIIS